MESAATPPIFIIGCNRSGTTLMQFILDSHPDIGIAPETQFLTKLKNMQVADKTREEIINQLFKKGSKYWQKIPVTKEELCQNIRKDSKRALFDSIIRAQAQLRNRTGYGEKTPDHIFHIERLKKWYTGAKFIQMVRDPRAVTISQILKVAKNKFPYSLHQTINIAKKWKHTSHLGLERKHRDDYKICKFESLIRNPTQTITEICDFLDIEMKEEMLSPEIINTSFDKKQKKGFNKKAVTRWKKYLSLINQFMVETICRKEMKKFGYKSPILSNV